MSRRAAILGLGSRGVDWASTFVAAGWDVRGFDPAPDGLVTAFWPSGCRREQTISGAVRGADWIVCCLPERLELVQMVLRRAQAEAPKSAILAVVSKAYDLEALQGWTRHPGQVFRLCDGETVSLELTARNTPDARAKAELVLAELAAVRSISMRAPDDDQGLAAESA
jgi:hypothetical protein